MFALKNVNAAVPAFTLPNFPGDLLSTWTLRASASPLVRVALVGSEQALSRSVARQLATDPRVQLIAWARTLDDAHRLSKPLDVVFVELDLEDGSGLDLVRHIKAEWPGTHTTLLTRVDNEEAALRAFQLGAAGCLVLCDWVGSFVLPVLSVANGGSALSPSLARRLMRPPASLMTPPGPADARLASITEREREVLSQVARGLRSKEIARQLAISDETVNAHVKSIYRKLQVHSRAQLVRVASQAGIC